MTAFSPRPGHVATVLLLLAVWLPAALAQSSITASDIKIEFVDARDRSLDVYPIDTRRAFLLGERGEPFALKISNRGDERVGLLLAVDGHNPISGGRAQIKTTQRMFVLDPKQTRTYRGWRTGADRVNRFRFGPAVDQPDEQDWGNRPDDGVVAVAVYRERQPFLSAAARQRHPDAIKGNGDRQKRRNPIAFSPRSQPLVSYFVKYQNRELLCRRAVIDCPRDAGSDLTLRDLTIEVVDDQGRRFAQYPLEDRSGVYRAYLEALPKSNYALRLRNYSDQTVGLVIAVDGRNIISGLSSDLAPSERMYVLGPGESAEYEGWRSGQNRVNRFFFSRAENAYASDWGDRSALGVIAVAAYPERRSEYEALGDDVSSTSSRKPGTGFGDGKRSPSREVSFEPQSRPFARYFVKYEWRDQLCRKDVIRCDRRGAKRDGRNPPYASPPDLTLSGPGWHDQYAAAAVAQYKDSRRRGCGFRGARWHDDYDRHLGWAQLSSRQKAQLEYNIRRQQLRRCQ